MAIFGIQLHRRRPIDIRTDNLVTDGNDGDEIMNDFMEENEETEMKVNNDDANIDENMDDMIEEKDYCNHCYRPQLDNEEMEVFEEEFQLMKQTR